MEEYILGSAVKIISVLDIPSVDSATITIEDPSDTEKVTGANMLKADDRVYYYVWQSNQSTDDDGVYIARVTVTSGQYTDIKEYKFRMLDQSDQ